RLQLVAVLQVDGRPAGDAPSGVLEGRQRSGDLRLRYAAVLRPGRGPRQVGLAPDPARALEGSTVNGTRARRPPAPAGRAAVVTAPRPGGSAERETAGKSHPSNG